MNVPLTTSLKKYWIYIYVYICIHICIILNPWNNHINEKTSPTPQKEVHHDSQPTTPWSLKIKKSWKQKGPTLRRTTTGDVVMWFQCQPCHWRRVWPRWWMNRCIQGSNLCRCRTAMDGKGMEMDGWDGCWEVGCLGFRGFRFFLFFFFEKKSEKKLADDRDRDSFFLMIDSWVYSIGQSYYCKNPCLKTLRREQWTELRYLRSTGERFVCGTVG